MRRGIRRAMLGVVSDTTAEGLVDEREAKKWEEFEPWLQEIERKRQSLAGRDHTTVVSRPLYRGQSNSQWKLLTTLERHFRTTITVGQYFWLVRAAKPFIETLTERRWNLPDELTTQDEEMLGIFPTKHPLFGGEGYEYLTYLRHHGFPSPLLDWSLSPYLALFFAFNDAEEIAGGHVSVFSFVEYAGRGKGRSGGQAGIHELGGYTRSHPRHFLQQGGYTVCLKENDAGICFAEHEEVFARADGEQDLLWKLNIPTSERRRVLNHLDRHNINAHSLFANEEGLARTIAFREIEAGIAKGILPAPVQAKRGV